MVHIFRSTHIASFPKFSKKKFSNRNRVTVSFYHQLKCRPVLGRINSDLFFHYINRVFQNITLSKSVENDQKTIINRSPTKYSLLGRLDRRGLKTFSPEALSQQSFKTNEIRGYCERYFFKFLKQFTIKFPERHSSSFDRKVKFVRSTKFGRFSLSFIVFAVEHRLFRLESSRPHRIYSSVISI